MRAAHKKLVEEKGLSDTHFDAIAELLAATLKDLGVAQCLIDEVMTIAGSTRNDVLNKPE
jgi:hemoglobin